jgi:hypothetical protein
LQEKERKKVERVKRKMRQRVKKRGEGERREFVGFRKKSYVSLRCCP